MKRQFEVLHRHLFFNESILCLLLLDLGGQVLLFLMTEEGKRASRSADCLNLGTRVVLSYEGQLIQVNIISQKSILFHLGGMDFENLQASVFVRQANLKMQFKTTRSEHRFVDHVNPIGHTDD